MVSFIANKISLDSESISEQMKRAREEGGQKIGAVAKKLNISQSYLEALENHEFWRLPKGVYGKKILQEYAMYLGLNYQEMMEILDKEMGMEEKEKEKQLFSTQVVDNSYFRAMPRMFRNILISIIIIVCFVYLGYRLDKIVSPPRLVLDSPSENLITMEKSIDVNGTTEAETQIVINGVQVLSDARGRFSQKVDLKTGINMITVIAKKKYGRSNVVQRQILVKDSNLEL